MSVKFNPAFAVNPRGDAYQSTLDWLTEYFERNPTATLEVTTKISRQTLLEFKRNKRASLASFRGTPRRTRVRKE